MASKREIYVVKMNEVYGRIVCGDPGLMEGAYKYFSEHPKNYWFDSRYKAGAWDGQIHYVYRNGKFLNGLFKEVFEYLKEQTGYVLEVDPQYRNDKDGFDDLKDSFHNSVSQMPLPDHITPYKHQLRGALKSLYYKRGICEHATSAGKSLTISLVINHLMRNSETPQKILILVPKIDLVEQFWDDMVSYGIPGDLIGKFFGYQKDTEEPIIVSTWQSIYKEKKFLKRFNVFICDEAHGLKADVVKSVGTGLINCEYRLGFTGTMPSIEKGFLTDHMTIRGVLGPVIDVKTLEELQQDKQISDIKIDVPYFKYSPSDRKKYSEGCVGLDGKAQYQFEKDFIINHKKRNYVIYNICKKFVEKGENVLVLINRKKHVEFVENILSKKEIPFYTVTGDITNRDVRNSVRKNMEQEGGRVLVATSGVYSTGVSIKRLHAIIFADAGKSKITTLQSVGRGLRLHDTKDKLHLYDFADDLKYSGQHLTERMEYYTKNNFEIEIKEVQL